ncbi:hypothetical protein [Mesorhizobium australicum]|uniref:Uncharacterized protein n=1 Tax=Mesorhizobium australicum TaxID=536018 RepID=A0A1X7NG24_9HYPH|nr:hypothetical protein [Mesorhizobium australicum]SMH36059.1 hypothetical protein SAMN02982922_1683 [Mesorhizobium australicum]
MAFNPDRLSLVVQPIGENGMRWFDYQSDDNGDVLLGTDYFQNAKDHGLRIYDLIFVSPEAGAVEPYVLVVDSISDSGHATAVEKLENLEREIIKTAVQYDKQAAYYAATANNADAAIKISGELTEEHTTAKSLLHLQQVNSGSGAESGPARAGYTFSAAAFKAGYPSTAAADGEIDTTLLTFRQVNGDAAAILGNGAIINGFAAFAEATTQSVDPVSFAAKHQMQIQIGVVNDRDGGEYGYNAAKTVGEGGTAFYGFSNAPAGWDYGLRLAHKGKNQVLQRTSDAALILFEFDNPANYVTMKVASGVLTIADSGGAIVSPASPVPVNYTPTATASSGTITTSSVLGRWTQLADKMRFVSIVATITNNGTGAGALRFTLPATASGSGVFTAHWLGRNLNTGVPVFGQIVANGTYVSIVLANNAYPVASGETIYLSGTYETA